MSRLRRPAAFVTVLALAVACTGGPEQVGRETEPDEAGTDGVTVGGTEAGDAVTLTFSDWHLAEDV